MRKISDSAWLGQVLQDAVESRNRRLNINTMPMMPDTTAITDDVKKLYEKLRLIPLTESDKVGQTYIQKFVNKIKKDTLIQIADLAGSDPLATGKWISQSIRSMIPPDEMMNKAFIRKCDTCGMVTAIDLDPTEEHWKEMCMYGQTIFAVTLDDAQKMWETAGKCECNK